MSVMNLKWKRFAFVSRGRERDGKRNTSNMKYFPCSTCIYHRGACYSHLFLHPFVSLPLREDARRAKKCTGNGYE